MQDIIKQFNTIWHSEDLFQAWQVEIRLRNLMRKYTYNNVTLNNADSDTLDFLYRSLYWTNKQQFFEILFSNMNDSVIYKWLISRSDLAREFLTFVPYQILHSQPDFRHLQFLINIYRSEYRTEFIRIINVLGRTICEELIKRTANHDLRTLLQQRLTVLQKQHSVFDYGIKTGLPANVSYPALFGDKLQLMLHAAAQLKRGQQFSSPGAHTRRFAALLEAAGAVFESGLIEDSVAILTDAYVSYLDSSRTVNLDEEAVLYKNLQRQLRRIIPIYNLISEPSAAFTNTFAFYRKWFKSVSPDTSSLQFLKVYETIVEGMSNSNRNILTEISLRAEIIASYRPGDIFIKELHTWCREPVPDAAARIHRSALERMRALPHESFVMLEFLHWAAKYYPACIKDLDILKDYIELWKWAPASLFFNHKLLQDLSPFSSGNTRREAEKIIKYMQPQPTSTNKPQSDFMELFARICMEVSEIGGKTEFN